jgi:lysophospholipase L1-like esterase
MRLTKPWSPAIVCTAALAVAAAGPATASAQAPPLHWVTTWGTSIQPDSTATLNEQTVRNIVHISIGGHQVRVRITNAFGGNPSPPGDAWTDAQTLQVGSAYVGRESGTTAAVLAGTNMKLTFGGNPTVRISPGTDVVSDPVPLETVSGDNLAVSIYVKGVTPHASVHGNALQRSFMSRTVTGDHSSETAATNFNTNTNTWWFLDAVSVATDADIGAVVALGDSITDGSNSSGTNNRWTDKLAGRLTSGKVRGVVNEGIGGDSIIKDFNCCTGAPSGLARLDRDVLSHDNVRTVIIALGVNDVGNYPLEQVDVAAITDGLRQAADKIHRHGIKVLVATITPFMNATAAGYWSPEKEVKREAINDYIRSSPAFDGVVDFAKALADPANPNHMLAAFDSGDHLHPNNAGHVALANAIQWVDAPTLPVNVPASDVGGSVPATLSLSLGAPPSLGNFVPSIARDYTATMTANVTSTAADGLLAISDPSTTAPGHLVNGAFALVQPLQVMASSAGGTGPTALAPVGGGSSPTPLLNYAGPVSNDAVTVSFSQSIGATEPLRTGNYAKTLVFTLSTTTP